MILVPKKAHNPTKYKRFRNYRLVTDTWVISYDRRLIPTFPNPSHPRVPSVHVSRIFALLWACHYYIVTFSLIVFVYRCISLFQVVRNYYVYCSLLYSRVQYNKSNNSMLSMRKSINQNAEKISYKLWEFLVMTAKFNFSFFLTQQQI